MCTHMFRNVCSETLCSCMLLRILLSLLFLTGYKSWVRLWVACFNHIRGIPTLGKMKDIFREHVFRLCQVDSWNPNVENTVMAEKIMFIVEQICELVEVRMQRISSPLLSNLFKPKAWTRHSSFILDSISSGVARESNSITGKLLSIDLTFDNFFSGKVR